VFIGFSEDINY